MPLGTAYDFFGPGLGVFVLTPNQLNSGQAAQPIQIDADFLDQAVNLTPLVQSVNLRIGVGTYMQGEIVIAPPFETALKLIESRLMDYGNVVLAQFGYGETGHVSAPFALFVNNYPDVELDPARSTITFKVQGFFSNSARKATDKVWDFDLYAPNYALGVLLEIAKSHNVNVSFARQQTTSELIGGASSFIPPDLSMAPPPFLTSPQLWQGKKILQVESDQDFLNRILAPANASVIIDANKLYVLDFKESLASTPVATFRMFGDVDTSNGVFPIINFGIRGSWWFQHPAVVGLEIREGRNPSTKISAPATSYDVISDPLWESLGDTTAATRTALATKVLVFPDGTITQIAVDYGPDEAGHRHFQSPRDPFRGRAERRARDGSLDLSGFKGTLKTFGLPYLFPMTNVAVEGVGRFSGLYQVYTIEHRIDSSGFFTTLGIRRNAVADGAALDGSNGTPVPGNSKIPPFKSLSDLNAVVQGQSQNLLAGFPGFGA